MPDAKYDTVIVGAGAVGLTMAVRLARAGRSILLLEAGPMAVSDSSQAFFKAASSTGHRLDGLYQGRFRCLGGTTNFWGGQLVRFGAEIFAGRDWFGAPAWPIGLADLTPHYDALLDLLGMSGVLKDDADVWQTLKSPPPANTGSIETFFSRWTPTSNLASFFSRELADLPGLTTAVNAQVTGFDIADDGRVRSIVVANGRGTSVNVAAGNVVLANGTIEICRLLMSEPATGRRYPWSANPWLGQAFLDHIDCDAGEVKLADKRRFLSVFENAVIGRLKYAPKLHITSTAQEDHRIGDVAGHFVFQSSIDENLTNLKIFARGILRGRLETKALRNPLKLLGGLGFAIPMAIRYLRYRRVHSGLNAGVLLRITAEQLPTTRSRIRLRNDRDAYGLPNVDVDWQIVPGDMETLARAAELIDEYLQANGLGSVSMTPALKQRDPAFLAGADDANHHMGGARMAASADDGVVDSDLRVFGSQNLFVAGAAVYPSSGFANPTFTAMALGQRLAERLEGAGHVT